MDLNALNQKFKGYPGYHAAAIRLPHSTDIYFIYSKKEPELNKLKFPKTGSPVFYYSPFGAGNLCYIFHPELVYKNEELILGDESTIGSGVISALSEAENYYLSKEEFVSYVNKCKERIHQNKVKKVVAARCEKLNLPESFAIPAYFNKLCTTYPDACVYYFSREGNTSWVGASPEKLITINKKGLETVALAGTLPIDATIDWTLKEKEEQSVTAIFIRNILKRFSTNRITELPVVTVNAGNLKHLSSTFNIKIDAEWIASKFHKLLQELNPTPAVCGLPQMESSSVISTLEGFERRFYSGFIGFFDGKEQLDLYVNLRCMEFDAQHAILYAGAGITADSDPEKEWDETQRKMQTLVSLI